MNLIVSSIVGGVNEQNNIVNKYLCWWLDSRKAIIASNDGPPLSIQDMLDIMGNVVKTLTNVQWASTIARTKPTVQIILAVLIAPVWLDGKDLELNVLVCTNDV